jgi:hypothetical protein
MIGHASCRANGFLLLAVLLATACSSGAQGARPSLESPTSPAVAETPRRTSSPDPPLGGLAKNCPLTLPGPWDPPPSVSTDALFGSEMAYGNGKLWVGGLGANGVIVATPEFVEEDGSVRWKLGWWREVSGLLTITGRRLDGSARPLRAYVPSGYGMTGFQASGVHFPTEGCWEVIGKVATTTLSFVTFVIKRAE